MPNLRGATHRLTRIGLVLSHRRGNVEWVTRLALLMAGLLIGAGAGFLAIDWLHERAPSATALQTQQQVIVQQQQQQQLQQQLEQSRQTVRLSEARSVELERQIATLVQQLRESQEELTFFRKAREGKH